MRRYYTNFIIGWLLAMSVVGNYGASSLRGPLLTFLFAIGITWVVWFLILSYREAKRYDGQKLKMYCVCSKEALDKMKGIRGKMITQGGHAYVHAGWDAEKRFPDLATAYKNSQQAFKITLVVPTEADLIRLEAAYRDRTGVSTLVVPAEADLIRLEAAYRDRTGVSLVRDAGLTVFKNADGSPNPTVTFLGIGPIYESDVDADIADLKTLT